MLKRIVAILLLVVIGLSLVACAPKACESCGAEGKELEKVKVADEKKWLCPTCATVAELASAFGGF